ncbi:hypothetical protein BOX15_Mlig010170g2 [Macrostomum lignano]|uniref:Uncharacterized protein n=1 Tax=Macrostomum lignano TaxID=282301 RepID=A0A267GH70_9PLAT|nr:hypothetical protein BOX15_Mlig010170g2 [Macrostomum lignano]
MHLSQVIFLCSLLLLLTSAQSPPGPRRLLRCPAEFAVLVKPLPDNPDVQPVLTTGPVSGCRLSGSCATPSCGWTRPADCG